MKAVTAKGLSDLRTATTTRVRSRPRHKGTAHLNIYLLSMERQRLETELRCLEKRQANIHERLGKICQEMGEFQQETEQERLSSEPLINIGAEGKQLAPTQCKRRPWKKIALDY